MITKVLAVFIATLLSFGMVTAIPYINVSATNGDDDSDVQVTVQREGEETEDINVTPNITVVVDFEQTQVTNETVTIGEEPSSNGGNASAPAGNETTEAPPQNATVTPPENQTETEGPGGMPTTPPSEGNETVPIEGNVTVPSEGNETIPVEGNVTVPAEELPPVSNETVPLPPMENETAPPVNNETVPIEGNVTVPEEPGVPAEGNETVPIEGNVTIPPEEPPIISIPPGNNTGPPVLENGTIPSDNGTAVTPEPPQNQPNSINLALIESIQRGHTQHITAYVTDDKGNEFNDETVNIKVVNARGKVLQNVQTLSGQDFAFKVGPNTSPQSINVFAILESDNTIGTQANYDVFPKARPAPPPVIDIPIELPPMLNQSGMQ